MDTHNKDNENSRRDDSEALATKTVFHTGDVKTVKHVFPYDTYFETYCELDHYKYWACDMDMDSAKVTHREMVFDVNNWSNEK